MLKILLTSLQDVLEVAEEAHFEQVVAELPAMLRSMRARAQLDGHAGFAWPIQWRPAGGPSTITSHFPGGEAVKLQLAERENASQQHPRPALTGLAH